MRIFKGDKIIVIKGKDRNREGSVVRVLRKNDGVTVSGVNIYKKHLKPSARDRKGGIIEVQRPLAVAKVRVICPHCQKPVRVGLKLDSGRKKRICKKCWGEI